MVANPKVGAVAERFDDKLRPLRHQKDPGSDATSVTDRADSVRQRSTFTSLLPRSPSGSDCSTR